MKSIFFCLVLLQIQGNGKPAQSSGPISYDTPLAPNTVRIAPHYIEMPVGKIFLIRKDNKYCAVKFTRFWTGRAGKDKYASYEYWYQDDGSGNFSNKNVRPGNDQLSIRLYGFGHYSFNFGNAEFKCGVFRLEWWGKGMVYFFRRSQEFGDYGFEFAPTKWKDIGEVNAFDTCLKWYKYDKHRARIDIFIDDLCGSDRSP